MRNIFLILIFCTIKLCSFAQINPLKVYFLRVSLKNAPFKSLTLLDYNLDLHQNVLIKGKSIGSFNWEFKIPDSVVENSENMILIVPDKDTIINAYHQIKFISKIKNNEISLVNIGIQDEINYIEAEYKQQILFENENVSAYLGLADSVVLGNLVNNEFFLSLKNDSSDITIRSKSPYYSWFYNNNQANEISYSDYLSSYLIHAKNYPNSKYLISSLARNLNKYKNRQDILNIYQNFSKKNRDSKWGKRIELFLSSKIENILFMDLATGREESILRDFSEYKLVIFSASWCIPCIKEIPLLKKLYADLGKEINFTFVSLDYEKDVKKFQEILDKNKIPWRSLYAYKNLDFVRDFFSINSIPHSLLIHADGNIDVIDVRKEEIQKKLYSLVEQ